MVVMANGFGLDAGSNAAHGNKSNTDNNHRNELVHRETFAGYAPDFQTPRALERSLGIARERRTEAIMAPEFAPAGNHSVD
jgi:hypothetical protein